MLPMGGIPAGPPLKAEDEAPLRSNYMYARKCAALSLTQITEFVFQLGAAICAGFAPGSQSAAVVNSPTVAEFRRGEGREEADQNGAKRSADAQAEEHA